MDSVSGRLPVHRRARQTRGSRQNGRRQTAGSSARSPRPPQVETPERAQSKTGSATAVTLRTPPPMPPPRPVRASEGSGPRPGRHDGSGVHFDLRRPWAGVRDVSKALSATSPPTHRGGLSAVRGRASGRQPTEVRVRVLRVSIRCCLCSRLLVLLMGAPNHPNETSHRREG